MAPERVVHVKCEFSRGGFPTERVFHIRAPGGGRFMGAAPVEYCFAPDGTPLRSEPARGEKVEGYVTGLVLGPSDEGTAVRAYLPNGEIYEVGRDVIEELPEATHVPVES
jgi:hypothetical protein